MQSSAASADQKPDVTKLCVISLILYTVPNLITGVAAIAQSSSIISSLSGSSSYNPSLAAIESLSGASTIAAWVLMIIARVKNKESTFAKVLMIVYIILAALAVIAFIVAVVVVIALLDSIVSSCG